jgi:hypothetical protein
MSSGV